MGNRPNQSAGTCSGHRAVNGMLVGKALATLLAAFLRSCLLVALRHGNERRDAAGVIGQGRNKKLVL